MEMMDIEVHDWTWVYKIHAASLHDKPKHRTEPPKEVLVLAGKMTPSARSLFLQPWE